MRYSAVLWLSLTLGVYAASAAAVDFLGSYDKPEFHVPVVSLEGAAFAGDKNARYEEIFFPIAVDQELLIIGEFPRARFFSITLYDDHGGILDVLDDTEIEPLDPNQRNPYRADGTAGAEDILYAVTVRLGSNLATQPVNAACGFGTRNVHVNVMDARLRHTAGAFYSCQQSHYSTRVGARRVAHDDGLNTVKGASIMLRTYLKLPPTANSTMDRTIPSAWLRQSATGCAIQPVGPRGAGSEWYRSRDILDRAQTFAHFKHEQDLGFQVPHGPDPQGALLWTGSFEYILRALEDRYLTALPPNIDRDYLFSPSRLNRERRVMRLQFRLPVVPCNGAPNCRLTGLEQVRYWGLSLLDRQNTTIATLADKDLKPDAHGYVDLIVSFGTALPAQITTANGYTAVQLPPKTIRMMTLRNILPAATFGCSTDNVPFRTGEHHPNGGYMGEYAPVATFPLAANLPSKAVPLVPGGRCQPPMPPPNPCGF